MTNSNISKLAKGLAAVQVLSLASLQISMFVGALNVKTLWDQLGINSPLVIALAAVATVAALVSFGGQHKYSRVGVIIFGLSIALVLGVMAAVSSNLPNREIFSLVALVALFGIVAGYFLLLFGGLKTAGWALAGSALAAIAGAAFWMLLMIIGTDEPMMDTEMANRMVTGYMLFASMVVSFIAFLLEMKRKKTSF